MRKIMLFFFVLPGVLAAQNTITSKNIIAQEKLRAGNDTSKYWRTISDTINASSTHRQGTTAKAVYNYVNPLRITTGDVTGTLPALTVDGLQGRTVLSTAPSTGQVLKWNGTAWGPGVDSSGGYYQTVQANGVSATQRATLNFIGSDPIAWTATDNAGKTDVQASINAGSITSAMIENGTITSADIASNTIVFADWAQNGATTTNSIPKWNGTAWAAAPDIGATVSNGIINDAGTLKIGGSFPSNRILSGNGRLVISPLTGTARAEFYRFGMFLYDSTGYASRVIGEYHAHQMKNYWGSSTSSGIVGMESTEDDGSYFSTNLTTGQKRFLTQFNLVNTTPTATSKWEFLSEDTLTASALDQGNMWLKRFSRNTSAAPRLNFVKRKQSGAIATNTFLSSGENMGQLTFSGDETSTKMSAKINAYATEAHSTSAQGGKVVVATTPNGSTATTDRLTVDQDGNIIAHAYTSARSDTNTIYGAAAFDANGRLIRVASGGGGGGADGNGIYDGSGTVPAGTVATVTDSLSLVGSDMAAVKVYSNSAGIFGASQGGQYYPTGPDYQNITGVKVYQDASGSSFVLQNKYTDTTTVDEELITTNKVATVSASNGALTMQSTDSITLDVSLLSLNGTNLEVTSRNDVNQLLSGFLFNPNFFSSFSFDQANGIETEFYMAPDNLNFSSGGTVTFDAVGQMQLFSPDLQILSDSIEFYFSLGNIFDLRSAPQGLTYASDYSATYTDRSLVDKAYVDNKTLSGSATLDFPNTASNATSDLTITVMGAAVGDPVVVGPPAAPPTNGHYMGMVLAADTVTIRYYGNSAGGNPASGTFKVKVLK